MSNPTVFTSIHLLLLVFLSCEHHVLAANAECPKPMQPVTKSQAKKLRPHGTYIFTDEPTHFSPALPASFITNPDFFNATIKPQCTDGKSQHQWQVTYTANGTAMQQTLNEYPPKDTPCKKYHDGKKWHNPEIFYGLSEIPATHRDQVNKNCSRGWRPMEVSYNRKEDIAYTQLMTDFFHFVVMPYTQRKRPFYYCNAGVQKMDFSRMGACFKELNSTVRIDGKKYGKGERAARAWGQVDYTCYGENNKQIMYISATIPFVLECDWNFTVQ